MARAQNYEKIKMPTAKDACTADFLSADVADLYEEMADSKPITFLESLIGRGYLEDSAAFLAQALPLREAIWWGCICVRLSLQEMPKDTEIRALKAAEAWAFEPTEQHAAAAGRVVDGIAPTTPAIIVGIASFWSGGRLFPDLAPDAKTPKGVVGQLVGAAVVMSAYSFPPLEAAERLREFIGRGLNIASGGDGKRVERLPSGDHT
jgi:hypothetical protein